MERKQLQRSNSKMERWRVAARKVLFSLHDEQLPSGRLGRDAAPSRDGTRRDGGGGGGGDRIWSGDGRPPIRHDLSTDLWSVTGGSLSPTGRRPSSP